MTLRNIKKTLGALLLTTIAVSATAQDLIARQAPVDRRMKDVNNVKLGDTFATNADLNDPASNIYTDWVNKGSRNAPGYAAAGTRIDLRGFAMPTPSRKINSPFGPRWGRNHDGLDIKVYIGDTICAAFDGKVRVVDFQAGGYGNVVVIRHPNGLETVYGHLSRHLTKQGATLKAGDPIGLAGSTGRSTGTHLHFETRLLGEYIDPAKLFDFAAQDVTGDFYVFKGRGRGTVMGKHEAGSEVAVNEEVSYISSESEAAKAQAQKDTRVRIHKVKKGETLYSIARKHGINLKALCRMNGLKTNSKVRVGQILKYS